MIIPASSQASSFFVRLAAFGAADADLTRMQHVLPTTDRILSIVAVALLVGTGGWWIVRPGFGPLSHAPPRPNRVREDALALVILTYLTTAVLISTLISRLGDQTESVFAQLVVGNSAHLAGIGACLFIAATRFQGGVSGFWFGAAREQRGRRVGFVAVLILVTVGLCPLILDAAVSAILHFAPDYEFAPHPTIKALHDATQPAGVVTALWVSAVIVAPVAEELFFRGLLQTFLVSVVGNRWLAIVLASLAFGAVHFQQPSVIPALTVLALLIGYAYERTGSLIPPIMIHAAFNLKTLIWDALGSSVV